MQEISNVQKKLVVYDIIFSIIIYVVCNYIYLFQAQSLNCCSKNYCIPDLICALVVVMDRTLMLLVE